MLTVKAKHATMLLTVSEAEGLSDGMEELSDEELHSVVPNSTSDATKQLPAHPSVVMVSASNLLDIYTTARQQNEVCVLLEGS